MQKTTSILLSLMLLLSTTGLTYGQHFCEGVVVDIALAFGVEKMDCGDVEAEDSCDDSPQEVDCCADVYYQIQTDKEFANKSFDVSLKLPVFNNTTNLVALFTASSTKEQRLDLQYLPPDFDEDRQSLYQVFII
ncbi:hypothetical protein [uncultured Planktosalinus sp.]|uniref:HYC_CC_PP family protein n=1 Tax=uncultured Planktosalinus sp. TaxID=1810935 RepID=UPI0030D71500